MCEINCSGGCIECAPDEHDILDRLKATTKINGAYPRDIEDAIKVIENIGSIKNREQTARFVEYQFSLFQNYKCTLPKGNQWHYGKQEIRELLDYIYGGLPKSKEEAVISLNLKNKLRFSHE